ncbi:peptidoglycan-binding protein [Streptomyces sp. CA-135486]|uniref:peptidoglycan-binding protein n=1 Tax=Streptomyces sp. CA-135486 TaxID=3240049 RepID=UPI003D8AABF0
MTVPVFEEFEPAADCDCAGCVQHRRALAAGEHPAAHGCRRALVLFTAAGVVLGGGGGVGAASAVGHTTGPAAGPVRVDRGAADPGPSAEQGVTEQGGAGPLHGPSGASAATAATLRTTTRAQIVNRAKRWLSAKVPYSMEDYWSDGYRQDCSGYVSMAWNLAGNEWTGSLADFATRITREELQPGDILLFHNPDNPTKGSHVTIFGGWADYTHTYYLAYEQVKPHTRKQATPMGYWTNADRYLPYRYKGLAGAAITSGTASTEGDPDGTGSTEAQPDGAASIGTRPVGSDPVGSYPGGAASAEAYPGRTAFEPGAESTYVTRLGEMLVARGAERFYPKGPGPRWGEAERLATEAFQLAQGWRGTDADGRPGPETWRLLVTGQGKDIPAAGVGEQGGASAAVPTYPGRAYFRPGRSNAYITQLGRQLVERGYGKHYTSVPGPAWGEKDRRNVEAFQRAQGWRGGAANGIPGPETWRRLFG